MAAPSAASSRTPAPNFFLVGAARSGTTTLWRALGDHDDVFLPEIKEPHVYAYLADPTSTGDLFESEASARAFYRDLYADAADETAIGDCSVTSLCVPGVAAAIGRDVPDARIVVILRQPVDRAYSHHALFVANGGERVKDFAAALALDEERRAQGVNMSYRYLDWSRYAGQLQPFVDTFGRDRVLVHLYDDLVADPKTVVRGTFEFLGVDPDRASPRVGRHNDARVRRFAGPTGLALRRATPMPVRNLIRRRMGKGLSRPAPPLDPRVRAELTEQFRDEISRLETMLDRDLSGWR